MARWMSADRLCNTKSSPAVCPRCETSRHSSSCGDKASHCESQARRTTSPTSPGGGLDDGSQDETPLPSGVFTLLTDCYSPTCSRDSLCYSIACPRRLEQQSRLNMKPQPGLSKQISKESLGDVAVSQSSALHIHSSDSCRYTGYWSTMDPLRACRNRGKRF